MRKLQDWIAGWLEYSTPVESPHIYRTWTALSTVSAALSRRCWVRVKGQRLFPNTYVLLVGPPGIGKGNAMREVRYWFQDTKQVQTAPDTITKRALYDSLEQAVITDENDPLAFDCSLFAYIEELGVFLHAGDNDFVYNLCYLYDAPAKVHYKTFGAGEHHIQNACFGFIAGVTPKALKDIFSEQAMELGISARTVLVFSDEKIKVDIFTAATLNEALGKDLQSDLLEICKIRGEYVFDEDAGNDVVNWIDGGMLPVPQDPRFEHYNTRRFVHFIKLCMLIAASRRSELVILQSDVKAAKTVLLEAERVMPKSIASLGANPLLFQQQTAIAFINDIYRKHKRGVSEGELRRRLSLEVHPQYVDVLIRQLCSARWITTVGADGSREFFPRGHGASEEPPTEEQELPEGEAR